MAKLPTGTVTFLFTDIEGSTHLWEVHPDAMKEALTRHDAILGDAMERHSGVIFSRMGDGVAVAFASVPDAVRAVVDAQRHLATEPWGATGPLRARMALYTDEGRLRSAGEYLNRPLNRCARLMAVAHGGQVLMASTTAALARDALPEGASLADLGEHRLRDLDDAVHVYQLLHPNLPQTFPPLRSSKASSGNLPRQLTSFVGRDAEITALCDLVRTRSLVTLTGVGGVGKTRLALQVAAQAAYEFADGAWLCELAAVTDPGALWDTLAASLGVKPTLGRSVEDSALEYLAQKQLLLVLDNCEHLLLPAARAAAAVIQRCPRVVLLVTSREGLALSGEQIIAVPSMDVPSADPDPDPLARTEAVRLFVDRAREVQRNFELTNENAHDIAQLCRRLDGIPLAIELAAARVRSLSPGDLVARLDQRFRLLTRGSRAVLERHQTLRRTIDWSYDLLSEAERTGLNRLSVFAGGCDLPAAEAVVPDGVLDAPDAIDVLGQLVDKSLVIVDEPGRGPRYRLLDTIRQYAQERLESSGEASEVRRRHADHYVMVSEAAGPHLRSRDQIEWADQVALDTDNFRTALDWAVEHESSDHAMRLVAPLAVNGTAIGYSAMDWAVVASMIPDARAHPLFPVTVGWATWGAVMKGDLERAGVMAAEVATVEEAVGPGPPAACQGPATLAFFRGDQEQAIHHAEEWLGRARRADDPYETANALIMLASGMQFSEPEDAIALLEEAIRIARTFSLASALSIALTTLGGLLPLDEAERALELLEEAVDVGIKVGDRTSVANASASKGYIAAQRGEWRVSLQASADAAHQQLRLGALPLTEPACAMGAACLASLGRPEPAAVLLGHTDAKTDRFGRDWWLAMLQTVDATLLDELGIAQLTDLRARGAAMEPVGAIEYLCNEAREVLSP